MYEISWSCSSYRFVVLQHFTGLLILISYFHFMDNTVIEPLLNLNVTVSVSNGWRFIYIRNFCKCHASHATKCSAVYWCGCRCGHWRYLCNEFGRKFKQWVSGMWNGWFCSTEWCHCDVYKSHRSCFSHYLLQQLLSTLLLLLLQLQLYRSSVLAVMLTAMLITSDKGQR